MVSCFFAQFCQKSDPSSTFIFLNSHRWRPFFEHFLQNKNLERFSSKIPYYSDHTFWKIWLKQIRVFSNPVFRRLRKSWGWYYRGILTQKIGRYPRAWYLFFWVNWPFGLKKRQTDLLGLKNWPFGHVRKRSVCDT